MALESLAPDQRAVVELVLKQNRSYADLAGLLGIADDAVRRRAHAGVDALATHGELDAPERARVTDYLLGQLGEDERAATSALLSSSAAARAWAQDVAEQLRPVARHELPELPHANGSGAAPRSAEGSEPPPRSSKRGGAVLIGACTVLLAALLVWLLNRDDEPGPARTRAVAARSATPAATAQALAELPLRAIGPSRATGIVQVNASQGGTVGIVVLAKDVKPSSAGEAYAVWLTDARRKAFRIGFEAKASGGRGPADGSLALSGPSPDIEPAKFTRALTVYDHLVVSLETSDTGTGPASPVLRGSLKRLQGAS